MTKNYTTILLFFAVALLISACNSTGVDENKTAIEGTWKSTEDKYYITITESTWTDYDLIRAENCYDSFSTGYNILAQKDNSYTVKFEGDSNEYEITTNGANLTMRNDEKVIIQFISSDVNIGSLKLCN